MSGSYPNYIIMNYAARRSLAEIGTTSQLAQLNRVFVRDLGFCQLCHKECSREDASRDHIKSFWLCTRAEFNDDSNVQLAHERCNSQKERKTSAKLRTVRPAIKDHLTYTVAEAFPDFPWKQWTDNL